LLPALMHLKELSNGEAELTFGAKKKPALRQVARRHCLRAFFADDFPLEESRQQSSAISGHDPSVPHQHLEAGDQFPNW